MSFNYLLFFTKTEGSCPSYNTLEFITANVDLDKLINIMIHHEMCLSNEPDENGITTYYKNAEMNLEFDAYSS